MFGMSNSLLWCYVGMRVHVLVEMCGMSSSSSLMSGGRCEGEYTFVSMSDARGKRETPLFEWNAFSACFSIEKEKSV